MNEQALDKLILEDEHGNRWTVTADQGEEGSFLRALCAHVLLLEERLREKSAEGCAEIEDGCIVIRVAIDNLPTIIEAGPHGDLIRPLDANLFSRDLLAALQEEAEDGTTPVHKLFDNAILRAFENGAEGVEEIEQGD